MGLRIANRPTTDASGFVTATVSKAEFGTTTEVIKHAKDDHDGRTYERFEMVFDVQGMTGPITMTLYTGTVLNGPIAETGRGKTKKAVYNRLTTVAIGFGFVTPKDLEGTITEAIKERVEAGLTSLVGRRVAFKLGRVEGKALTVPVPESVKLLD